jgi:hypothetical protein
MDRCPDMPPRHREALELLCVVILRESSYQSWFRGLMACPVNLRVSALLQMITEMRGNHEDPALIDAVSCLCDPDFCKIVERAILERA